MISDRGKEPENLGGQKRNEKVQTQARLEGRKLRLLMTLR